MLVTDATRESDDSARDAPQSLDWTRAVGTIVAERGPSATVTAPLLTSNSGIEHIYLALDELVSAFSLDDALIIVEERSIGRQVFRSGRRPIESGASALIESEPGLYTSPGLPRAFDTDAFLQACELALHLEMLRYDAWHDSLTGLFDRRSFEHLLEMSVARSRRYDWAFTLVLIDVDEFKDLNDRLGHAGGDRALRSLAERFLSVLRIGDIAARIGGDEFALILPNAEPREIPDLLLRIARSSASPTPCPPFSYGWARCPNDAATASELFDIADRALYAHKAGRPQGA